jgi:hypothetical protein
MFREDTKTWRVVDVQPLTKRLEHKLDQNNDTFKELLGTHTLIRARGGKHFRGGKGVGIFGKL